MSIIRDSLAVLMNAGFSNRMATEDYEVNSAVDYYSGGMATLGMLRSFTRAIAAGDRIMHQ
jgi:hypothetical protein